MTADVVARSMESIRDLLLRALLVAVASALASGGVVYFVVDQSLRGVEAAVMATNARISSVDTSIVGLEERLSRRLGAIDAKVAGVQTLKNDLDDRTVVQDALVAEQDRDFMDMFLLLNAAISELGDAEDAEARQQLRAQYIALCSRAVGRISPSDRALCLDDL